MDTIGKRIAHHRKLKDLTQVELAEKLDLSVSAISQWEQEKTEPSISNLKALCQEFETPLEWLAFGTGKSGIEDYLIDITQAFEGDPRLIYLSDYHREFVTAFSVLPADQQEKVIEYISLLAGKYGQATSAKG